TVDALVERAARLADDVLFPAAMAVDAADRVPASHLDLLAAEGFYGVTDEALVPRVVEVLASGCLATTFVWLQHLGVVRGVARGEPAVREAWLEPLCAGRRRAGVVLAALRPGRPSVRATAVPGGYRLDGEAPWVTGWGMVDVLHTAARDADDTVVWLLLDARASASLTVTPLDLTAVNASRTVHLRFDGLFVPADRLTGTLPFAGWP